MVEKEMTVQIRTQGQVMGDLHRPIRLNAAARGEVKDSGGGGGFHRVLAFGAGQRKARTESG